MAIFLDEFARSYVGLDWKRLRFYAHRIDQDTFVQVAEYIASNGLKVHPHVLIKVEHPS